MILQFLHPHFLVEHHTDLLRPDEFSGFEVNLYGYLPKFGLVWLGYIPRPPPKEGYTTDDDICSLVDGEGNSIDHPLHSKPKALGHNRKKKMKTNRK